MIKNNKQAILMVGHGTRDANGIDEFINMVDRFRNRLSDQHIDYGFLEFASPTIGQTIERLHQQGYNDILVLPMMLTSAGHAKNDIPSELNHFAQHYPDLKIRYGRDLSIHPFMLQAAKERIIQAEQYVPSGYSRQDSLLLVVGRGTSDPDANSNICKISRMLWEGLGFAWAETCFSGVCHPLVPEALDRIHSLGFSNVIVFPYFLFTGVLIDRIYHAVDEAQLAHGHVNFVKAPYLNDHEKVLDTMVERLQEINSGTANMNCQLCKYREQIIGFEEDQGKVQQGHHFHVRGIGVDHKH